MPNLHNGRPNVDTCRNGLHPWPESRVPRMRAGKKCWQCGPCRTATDRSCQARRPRSHSKYEKLPEWQRKTNTREHTLETYDFMVGCGFGFDLIAKDLGVKPKSLETMMLRYGRRKQLTGLWR